MSHTMIRVALAGHRGRTGGGVAPAPAAAPAVDYVGGVGSGDDLAAFLRERRPQALVDFTSPAAALGNGLAAVAGRRGVSPSTPSGCRASSPTRRSSSGCPARR